MILTTTLIEKKIRSYLKEECETTLPRFDVMAALDRAGEKITMSQLSERLLVSNGNVTVLINRLVEDDIVDRNSDENDRRIQYVSLTEKGRSCFHDMAKIHESYIDYIFSDLTETEISNLLDSITNLSITVHKRLSTF